MASARGRALLAAVAVLALLLLLRGFYRRELYHFTGAAEWMWISDDVRVSRPTAGLFLVHLRLHDRPLRAVAKVCGERQYVLWVNGQPVAAGQNRPLFRLDVVPVTDLLTAGDNLIAIEARSHTSVGAVLFALDLEPSAAGRSAGDARGRNVVTSGDRWRVVTEWGEPGTELGGRGRRPWIWGRPPDHPWSYPPAVVSERSIVQAMVSEPLELDGDAFRPLGKGRWGCDLPREIGGYLWLVRTPDGGWPSRVEVGGRQAGATGVTSAPVVSLEGQTRWLFPGFVRGTTVVVEGERPPLRVELVEAIEG